jgi:hypothetical protein
MNSLFSHKAAILGIFIACTTGAFSQNTQPPYTEKIKIHNEVQDDKYLPYPAGDMRTSPSYRTKSTGIFTSQVNVNTNGQNILGDAANEPSIAVDMVNPNRIVIGWRQFDNVLSNFRQAGYGYSSDSGQTWTFPGVINQGVFRSDPVLDCDNSGNILYNSLTSNNGIYTCRVFKSDNGGVSWDAGTEARGGDKQWMAVDHTNGIGAGNIYSFWTSYYSSCYPGFFTRSTDDNNSYESCVEVPDNPYWGTLAVGNEGELYVAGAGPADGLTVQRSQNAQDPAAAIYWDQSAPVYMDGYISGSAPINPVGLVGQASIDVDRSNGPGRGNVYVLASMARLSSSDPADVMFSKSIDGGLTWSDPIRINTDQSVTNYQWFGTMSVAPNGRIDAIWLDTRDGPVGSDYSALYYSYSTNQGESWSPNEKLSNSFNPHVGYPQQDKMGDYFDMVSDETGANLAWANTLNDEQDVWFSRIVPQITGIEENPGVADFGLNGYPNPFRNTTNIHYNLTNGCFVNLVVLNIYGETVKTVVDKDQPAGNYTLNFSDANLPAGFYICRLTAGGYTETIRLVKIK